VSSQPGIATLQALAISCHGCGIRISVSAKFRHEGARIQDKLPSAILFHVLAAHHQFMGQRIRNIKLVALGTPTSQLSIVLYGSIFPARHAVVEGIC